MKKIYPIILGLVLIAATGMAFSEDNASIPQVSGQPASGAAAAAAPPLPCKNTADDRDYQQEVLSDPSISNIARAQEITGDGGNTAVVVQHGKANHSTVTQSGCDNAATQIQTGEDNDLQLDQEGDHNRSAEKQTGDYNHKVVIQNGQREESTDIQQVEQKPDEEEKP